MGLFGTPSAPSLPVRNDPVKVDEQARDASLRMRQRAASAKGRGDTILTGPLGVPDGEQDKKKKQTKTILGY